MAEQKKKPAAGRSTNSAKNNSKKKVNTPQKQDGTERRIPARLISASVFLALFVVFLVVFFNSEGVIPGMIEKLVHGLIGRVGFVVSVPALLYLFVIHAFSKGRPVIMRSICIGCFVAVCGCISHLLVAENVYMSVSELYINGINHTSGGLLCGAIAMLVYYFFNSPLSYVVLIIAAIFTLLGGMQITVVSIIRAIKNRPRAEIEDEVEERPEPAAIVVNHIANKRIEYLEQKRERRMQKEAEGVEPVISAGPRDSDVVADMFRQIDSDIETPVSAASDFVPAPEAAELMSQEVIDPVSKMPPLVKKETPEKVTVKRVKREKVTPKEAAESAEGTPKEIADTEKTQVPAYAFPPIDLLKTAGAGGGDGTAEMRENTRRLNETLSSFKIEAHIINVTRGPSVTRYEVELEKGVRLNKLTSVADDIALSLGAVGVRIAAIPGKISVVGIEVPNRAVTTVSLREVIDSQEFDKAKSKSSFAVGKDIGGNCIVGNIAKLPHMLIAGTTGSGKSVCMNSIIISLLYKASPDDVKLIMVDPKMVELGIYNGIPHLLIPVVTDPKKAAGSLQWAVSEMMRRYKAMSDAGVRDLESYNSIVESQETEATKLPQVVVIIDELADLMLVAAKEVEESICRIAQMGRAAGIHLIIATQRPSADVITGLMKANIPSRIAFAVASAMESRIILDTQGAEKLVGKGDMLYSPIGSGKPKRVQGCFVSDPEVEAVATYVKENFVTNYDQQIMEEIERKAVQTGNKPTASDPEPNADELAGDEMLPAAVDVILETGQASVSMLQRRLKLGYARAARIVDEMEEKGIVGPFQGSKPRDILITKEQWATMQGGTDMQMGFDDLEEMAETEDFDTEEY